MQENYKILNVSPDCTDEELKNAYETLKKQYSEDRFLEGEKGNLAAKNLTKLESAYREIVEERKEVKQENSSTSKIFEEVENAIKAGDVLKAQDLLDNCNDRNAEWHYLQSVLFYKKNWNNESLKQLEIAVNMDPKNSKYSDALNKLKEKMNKSEKKFHTGYNAKAQEPRQDNGATDRQMGGGSCDCCSFCATWCCMDMLCNMCCR